ncbi:MAG: hypothetical protein J0M26_05040 [Planctomycetes bacterium]|nr:hypothetical protein [Planctomycetota bacterium]
MANENLQQPLVRIDGNKCLTIQGKETPHTVLDFWQWSSSDLLGNTMRGVLAEYIVGTALGILKDVRIEWAEYDLLTHDGIKLEIKCSAYLQSWSQKRLSKISFGIEPKMPQNPPPEPTTEPLLRRQADVYVFCLLHHRDMLTVNPLDLDQWTFYCLATKKLDAECRDQKTLSLSRLLSLGPLVATYGELASQVRKLGIIDQGQPTSSL